MECVYCDNPDIQARMITENGTAKVFPTNIPITPGHVLVIPKRHVATLEELTDEEVLDIRALTLAMQRALIKLYGVEGFNIAFNQGEIAGQSVPHFHLHIVPRKEGDTGITKYEPREFLYRPGSRETSPEAELAAVAKQIKEAL